MTAPMFIHLKKPTARRTFFDTSTNGWPTYINECQTAIEYAKQNAEGFPRAGIPLISNGTMSDNEWWTYSELTPDRRIRFPVATKINELTWDATGDDVSFDLEFYKNGIDPSDIFWTYEVRNNVTNGEYLNNLTYTFAPGDWIRIKYKDQGKNISDGVLVLWISRIAG